LQNTRPPSARLLHEGRYEEEFGHDDNAARSIRTVVPHELERVEEDEDQLAQQEEDEEDDWRRQRVGRPRTPEPMGMGMNVTEDDDEPRRHRQGSTSPRPSTTVDELRQRLNYICSRIESPRPRISRQLYSIATPPPPIVEATPPPSETLTQMLNEWKKSVEGQWSSVREEWASERERLASAREEWEAKVKIVEFNLGSAAAKSGTTATPARHGQRRCKGVSWDKWWPCHATESTKPQR
jgi:hypothetical protein